MISRNVRSFRVSRAWGVVLLLATISSACRPIQTGSAVSTAEVVPNRDLPCDYAALEAAFEAQGIREALHSDLASCLDTGDAQNADLPVDAVDGQGNGGLPWDGGSSADESGFALAEPGTIDVSVVLGYEVMSDLADSVSRISLEGSGAAKIDPTKVKAQAETVLKAADVGLEAARAKLSMRVHYSFSDLFELVKTRFVDPAVYGYDGFGHRIIHRRYSRSRGIVYRVVVRKLTEALDQFDARARAELASLSKPHISLSLTRHDNSISMRDTTFVTLRHDGEIIKTVDYAEVETLSELVKARIALKRP